MRGDVERRVGAVPIQTIIVMEGNPRPICGGHRLGEKSRNISSVAVVLGVASNRKEFAGSCPNESGDGLPECV